MRKSQLKSLIREAVSARLTTESTMGDIDIIAQESATFDEFVNKIKTDPDYKSVDVNDPEVKVFLQQMYNDSQEMNEVSGFTSGKQFIDIKLQKYPKALAKVNELITMIGESKFTMEMAEWLFDFFNNASFERPVSESKRAHKLSIQEEIRKAVRAMLKEADDTNDRVAYKDKNNPNFIYIDIKYTTGMGGALTALGSTTMSGSARKQGAERAMVIAKDTANELEKSYQLDDIDVQDLGNGKVQIFAVSDDFTNIDPKTDSKLKAIVDKFKHNL